jgi:hypothetical protein
MTTEQWHSGFSWDETVKAAVEHQEAEQDGKKLPVTCINDFADILSLYVTSGELTPAGIHALFHVGRRGRTESTTTNYGCIDGCTGVVR